MADNETVHPWELDPEWLGWETCPNGHGERAIVNGGTTPGFTGAPIYWTELDCGCQVVDTSADNLGAAR